jgi:hypothetical protein
VLGYPLTPLGFIVPVALIVLLRCVSDPVRSGIGLAIVMLGLPAYEAFLLRPSRADVEEQHTGPPSPRARP